MSIASAKTTDRWTIEEIGPIDTDRVVAWLKAIPFSEWPQQAKIDDQLRPAMVSDPTWHGFEKIAVPLVEEIACFIPQMREAIAWTDYWAHTYQWMLSAVMPGHSIDAHCDSQADYWLYRVHVPLMTNPKAVMLMEDGEHHLEAGKAYRVNVTELSGIANRGSSPRVHFMFDVRC